MTQEGGRFLRNQWYVAAWAHEIGREPVRRWLLNEPLVMYRTEGGDPVILSDRCPHRSAPLSAGWLVGDAIQCGYHGFQFGPDGRCVDIPGQDTVPPQVCVRRYPSVEKWGWVFVWMGDPALADEATVPDYHWLDDPEWVGKGDTLHVKASYELLRDNLLDLTHAKFLHQRTLATDAVTDFPIETKVEGDLVHLRREMINVRTSTLFSQLGDITQNVDHKQNVECRPPAHIVIKVGAWPTAGSTESNWVEFRVLNALTPETDSTTHYFWTFMRNFDLASADKTWLMYEQNRATFLEDIEMVEQQQVMLETDPAPWVPVTVAADRAVVQARRVFDRLLEEEAGSAAPRASAAE